MKIETITYKRVKNLGNYQTETFEASATLEEDDHPETAAQNLIRTYASYICTIRNLGF